MHSLPQPMSIQPKPHGLAQMNILDFLSLERSNITTISHADSVLVSLMI